MSAMVVNSDLDRGPPEDSIPNDVMHSLKFIDTWAAGGDYSPNTSYGVSTAMLEPLSSFRIVLAHLARSHRNHLVKARLLSFSLRRLVGSAHPQALAHRAFPSPPLFGIYTPWAFWSQAAGDVVKARPEPPRRHPRDRGYEEA